MFKNYFFVFISTYFIVITTKLVFAFYLRDYFNDYSNLTLVQTVFLGFRFDFAISAIIAFIAGLFDFNKTLFIGITSTLLLSVFALQISDIFYFNEASRHIGYEIQDAMTDNISLFMTAYTQHFSLTVSGLIAIPIILTACFFFFKHYFSLVRFTKITLPAKFLLLLISVFFIRGMFNHIPLTPWQASQIGDEKRASISLNASYNILYSLANRNKRIQQIEIKNLGQSDIKTAFKQIYQHPRKPLNQHLNKPNVVFLFLESWSAIYLKSYGFKHNTTPYFEQLLKKSIRPKGMLAGGHRTTEGLFTTLTSYQNPLGRSVAESNLQDYQYNSIIDVLNKDGYSSIFFQGTSKETSGTGAFVQKLGFQKSFGKHDVKQRRFEENSWGVYDQDLYQFALQKASQLKSPFVIGINGATTHDQQIPKGIKPLHFSDDATVNNKLNALHFSDVALKEFIEETQARYPNTLFVLLADHCGSIKGNAFENYLIPFALYHKDLKPAYHDVFISQRDVVPSVLDLLYGDYRKVSQNVTGKSLISDSNLVADYYHNGILGWVNGNKAIEINIHTEKQQCYDVSTFTAIKETKKIACDDTTNPKQALSFTQVSQELLVSGQTFKFHNYRKPQ